MDEVQNSGNPVLDSLVNLLRSRPVLIEHPNKIRELHLLIRQPALREPGGLGLDGEKIPLDDDDDDTLLEGP